MNQIALYSFNNSKMLPNRCQFAMLQAEKYGITTFQQACILFPLAIDILTPSAYGDSVCVSVQTLLFHTPDTIISMIISITNSITVMLLHIERNF